MASRPTAGPAPAPSLRVRLARLALGAALGVPAVARTVESPTHRVVDGTVPLNGILVVAAPGGRYDIGLQLAGSLVPLHPLGDAVRTAVTAAAAAAGLSAHVGRVDVEFIDVEPAAGRRVA